MGVIRTRILLATLAASAVAAPASARPIDCPGAAPHAAREFPLVLPDGERVRVRDPYGGVLPADRGSFRFSVRGTPGALDAAGTVRWFLDGRRVARAAAPPFRWTGRTSALPPGRHTVTVQAEPRDGVVATTSFTLRVVACADAR